MSRRLSFCVFAGGLAAVLTFGAACGPRGPQQRTATDGSLAAKSFVAPGEKDEYYLFYSGGHSGQVFVAGHPSMRHITTIPVFAPYPATGYGFDEESKKMMGEFTWGDVHHPALSQTDVQVRRPLAVRERQRRTTASRASICAISRRTRSSGRSRTRAATTARRS